MCSGVLALTLRARGSRIWPARLSRDRGEFTPLIGAANLSTWVVPGGSFVRCQMRRASTLGVRTLRVAGLPPFSHWDKPGLVQRIYKNGIALKDAYYTTVGAAPTALFTDSAALASEFQSNSL